MRSVETGYTHWHFLDALSIWGKEFASALNRRVSTTGWVPKLVWTGAFERWQRETWNQDPPLRLRSFPLQRGYRRLPAGLVSSGMSRQAAHMLALEPGDGLPVLVLTSPYYLPIAKSWAGPVIYYLTDLLVKYGGFRENQISRLDRELCQLATLVCPNSKRIAEYLTAGAHCPSGKIVIVPNATREENLLAAPPSGPGDLPEDLKDLPRPIAGVIGNLAANMDWELLERVIVAAPFLSWAFIGPTQMAAGGTKQEKARARIMKLGGRVRFTGAKPYSALRDYARAFDVAIAPYRKCEPTYSGSSTRFYEHLAACRPILATAGFAELLDKEPLVRVAEHAGGMIQLLEKLRASNFQDGYEALRWRTSWSETWEARASLMISALAKQTGAEIPVASPKIA